MSIDSFIQLNLLKKPLICLGMKQVIVFISKSLIIYYGFAQKTLIHSKNIQTKHL